MLAAPCTVARATLCALTLLGVAGCAASDAATGAGPTAADAAHAMSIDAPRDARVGAPPGPHAVGFRASVALDGTRRYRTAFDDGATYGAEAAPRPVLVNLWYPADAAGDRPPMPHGEYFAPASDDPALAAWSAALARHAADTACALLLEAPPSELDAAGRAAWQAVLARPAHARRDAPPRPGPFPVVLYHPGAGSSFEDNAGLAEHLASHGYVVLASAFPEADGSGWGIDGGQGSVDDLSFLARHAAALPFADATRLALAGHSAGAQAALRAQLQSAGDADALVLLDSTLDYYTPTLPTWRGLTEPVLARPEAFALPLLAVAGPDAAFMLVDALVHADRTLLALPELGHDEFIQQGVLALHARADTDAARAARVRRLHAALEDAVRRFLDAALKDEPAALDALRARWAANPLGGGEPHVAHVPPGRAGPPAWDAARDAPPTPRQLRPLLDAVGVQRLLAILTEHAGDEPAAPVHTSGMLHASLLHDLVLADRVGDARALHAWLAPRGVDAVGTLRFLALMGELTGRLDHARHYLGIALQVAPEDPETLARLAALDAAE